VLFRSATLPREQLAVLEDEAIEEIALAIVRGQTNERGWFIPGACITNTIIHELRMIIEAVNEAAEAECPERIRDDTVEDSRPTLVLAGCLIKFARCDRSKIKANIDCHKTDRFGISACPRTCCFTGRASFWSASFAGRASFDSANFASNAWFNSTHFAAKASFRSTSFDGSALFGEASFAGEVSFNLANFAGPASFDSAIFSSNARFDSTHFADTASFNSTSFTDTASFNLASFPRAALFRSTSFADKASFSSTSFAGGALFDSACFADAASFWSTIITGPVCLEKAHMRIGNLSVSGLNIQSGGGLLLSERQLINKRGVFESIIFRLPEHSWTRWLIEYIEVALWPIWWLLAPLHPLADILPYGPFIEGSDKHESKALASASNQYNILRDNFRQQPSTDEQEDICHFMYMDCKRRARWAELWERLRKADDVPDDPEPLGRVFMDWIHLCIMNRVLGYMIRTRRIVLSGLVLMLIFAAIYEIWGGPGTISHTKENPNDPLWDEGRFSGIYFSLVTFVTLGFGDFSPKGWMQYVTGIEGLLGVTLIAMFTVAWGRKIIR